MLCRTSFPEEKFIGNDGKTGRKERRVRYNPAEGISVLCLQGKKNTFGSMYGTVEVRDKTVAQKADEWSFYMSATGQTASMRRAPRLCMLEVVYIPAFAFMTR